MLYLAPSRQPRSVIIHGTEFRLKEDAAPSKLLTIQAARGVAALLVIVFHCSKAIFSHREYWPRDPLHHLFAWGHLGVELFFVISGFIILQAHWRDIGQATRLGSYVRKRFLRIYPIYWIVLLGLIPVYAVVPAFGTGHELDTLTLLSSFSLVHLTTASVVLVVSWTLFFEILFYVGFAFLIIDQRAGLLVLGAWWSLTAIRLLSGGPSAVHGLLDLYAFDPFTLLFGFGMAAALFYRRDSIGAPGSLAFVGAALFVINGLLEVYGKVFPEAAVSVLAGLFAAVALGGFAALERRGRIRVPAPLALVGDASYSIYLVHFPVLSLAAKVVLHPMLRVVPPIGAEFVLILLAIGAGLAFHLAVERRVLALLSRGGTKVAPALLDGPGRLAPVAPPTRSGR